MQHVTGGVLQETKAGLGFLSWVGSPSSKVSFSWNHMFYISINNSDFISFVPWQLQEKLLKNKYVTSSFERGWRGRVIKRVCEVGGNIQVNLFFFVTEHGNSEKRWAVRGHRKEAYGVIRSLKRKKKKKALRAADAAIRALCRFTTPSLGGCLKTELNLKMAASKDNRRRPFFPFFLLFVLFVVFFDDTV